MDGTGLEYWSESRKGECVNYGVQERHDISLLVLPLLMSRAWFLFCRVPLMESSMRWKEVVIKFTNGHTTSQASVLSTLAIARVDMQGHEFCCWFFL